jgi:hypothetical protein
LGCELAFGVNFALKLGVEPLPCGSRRQVTIFGVRPPGVRAKPAKIKDILDLHRQGTAPCDQVTVLLDQHIRDIDRAIADLQSLRASLAAALKAARSDRRRGRAATVCRIIESADRTTG